LLLGVVVLVVQLVVLSERKGAKDERLPVLLALKQCILRG
jgi:hypothetical protein